MFMETVMTNDLMAKLRVASRYERGNILFGLSEQELYHVLNYDYIDFTLDAYEETWELASEEVVRQFINRMEQNVR
jgi:ribosomal protein L5